MNWTAGVHWTYPSLQPVLNREIRDRGEGQDNKTLGLLILFFAAFSIHTLVFTPVWVLLPTENTTLDFVLHIINVIIPFPSGCERVVTNQALSGLLSSLG